VCRADKHKQADWRLDG